LAAKLNTNTNPEFTNTLRNNVSICFCSLSIRKRLNTLRKTIIKIEKLSPFFLLLFVLISAFMQVLPVHAAPLTLNLAPLDAVVGDTVAATGSNATVNGEIRLYIGNIMLTSTIADEAGTYSARFVVPPVRGGTHTIIALDVESGDITFAFLRVRPRILVTPTVGSFNDRISVRGEGFATYESVALWLEGTDVTPSPTPITDSLGTFETSFQMPALPNGAYTLNAVGMRGDTARTLITAVPKIFVQPTSGAANTIAQVFGYGFSVSTELTLFFDLIDVTPYTPVLTSPEGSFNTLFLVPNVSDGTYSVSAYDNMGNVASSTFVVPSPIIGLTPSTIFGSSLITVEGIGFQPEAPVMLYLEDIATTSSYNLMAGTENIMPKTDGSFQYSLTVPIAGAGAYQVTAYQIVGPAPSDLLEVASAKLTIMKRASLDADIATSTLHFRGEIAEFYFRTALDGELVDVQIDKALFYSANAGSEDLTSGVTQISKGFYRLPYAIPEDASFGTYTLLVDTSLHTSQLEAFGSAMGSFTISPFFTAQAAQVLDIQNNIATVIAPDLGTVKANLSAINARLGSIEGNIALIQSDIGTLETSVDVINATLVGIEGTVATVQSDLGTLEINAAAINATLVSIDGNTATIESDLGTISTSTDAVHAKVASIENGVATVSSDIGTVRIKSSELGNQVNVATLFAVAAAIAASASTVIIYRRKPPKTPTTPSASPPTEKPPTQSASALTQTDKEEPVQVQTQTEAPEEAPKPTESPVQEAPPTAEPSPQAQSPPDSTGPEESPPQMLPEPESQPQTVVSVRARLEANGHSKNFLFDFAPSYNWTPRGRFLMAD
jgi:hypothetical protein